MILSVEPLEENQIDAETQISAARNLFWAFTQAGYYRRAELYARALYQEYGPPMNLTVLRLVRTYNARLEFQRSLDLLDELLYQEPNELPLRITKYLVMLRVDQKEKALAEARQWLSEKPDDKRRTLMVTSLLARVGEHESALTYLRQALEDTPDDEGLQLQLVDALTEAGKYDQADEYITQHQPADLKKGMAWLDARIALEISRGGCRQAISHIDQFAGENSNALNFLKLKAQLQYLCGETGKAADRQQGIVEKDPCDTEARLRYSLFLDRTGKIRDAAEQLDILLQSAPNDAGVMNNLGYLLIESHQQIERAEQLLRESLRLEPDSGPTLDSLGWFYYKRGDFQQALEYIYQAAAQLTIPDAELLEHLGDVHYRLGRKEKAGRYWQWAREQLARRVKTERYLAEDLEEIEKRLEQLKAGVEVKVAPLFAEQQ
jgi:tetratricopeptide (TPR) repeat protein